MKRSIKFKAKTSDGEWVEGDLIHGVGSCHGNMYILPIRHIYPKGCNDLNGWNVIPESVCQFTGLTDKNGKEIYEGDIVKYPNDNRECEVIYRANDYGAGFLTDSHDGIHSLGDVMNTLEVIGNIHDK